MTKETTVPIAPPSTPSSPRRIRQLSPEVITKIAAGEVIERPASVVKELLENAVDAGASRIEVGIEQGGAELMRVVDNGGGIAAEDLPLAFASHATSKLAGADDLFRVQSLGFRGEALASIGGVAQVTLQSRPAAESSGAALTCHGGQLSTVQPWNGAPGTRIEVRHLFFNTPVRRKFLRTTATEIGHIAEMVTRVALSQPTLALKLTHNDRLVFEVPGAARLHERLRLFFGQEVQEKLLPVDASQGPVRLSGYIADPVCERGNARMQYLFVNGRWVRDRSLSHALQEAYRGLLMTGRYAVAFLFLELPPDQVDVNVHPTKIEVRFRDANPVYHLLLAAVRERLRAADLTARLRVTPAHFPTALSPAGQGWPARSLLPPVFPLAPPPRSEPWSAPPPAESSPTPSPPDAKRSEGRPDGDPLASPPSTATLEPPAAQKAIQLYDAYVVVETPEGMLVIDQHALHERILYEHWKDRVRAGAVETQRLLVPEAVDLTSDQAACALDHQTVLEQLGLGVEEFGGGTVLVTSYPALLRHGAPGDLLRSAVEYLTSKDRPPSAEQLFDSLLKMLACRAAIKAGDHLGPEEIAALIAQRHLADDTHHCPHGRPTALLLSKQELDRQFKRV